ncbi:MAG TPA: DUF1801 domain-containing protein [Puia sp.]|nr:DUF1801 domain-containing protein [Puia sp.]
MNPKVDNYFATAERWQKEMARLRTIVLDCGLTEELKWKVPCYTFQNANVAIINPLKSYCAFGFFKGALLQDADGILSRLTEHTHAVRLIRFTDIREIVRLEPLLKAYIYEAIEVEKAGLKFTEKNKMPAIPQELHKKFAKNATLKKAFYALTPGRQRAYLLHFAAPKQSRTREARIEKYVRHILEGRGMND